MVKENVSLFDKQAIQIDKKTESTSNYLFGEVKLIRADLVKIKSGEDALSEGFKSIYSDKLGLAEFDNFQTKLMRDLSSKANQASIEQLYQTLNKETKQTMEDNRNIINKSLQSFENEVKGVLEKKANAIDVHNAMKLKLDEGVFHVAMEDTAARKDAESLSQAIQELAYIQGNKLDSKEFDRKYGEFHRIIDELNKDISSKSGIKEVLDLVKNKAGFFLTKRLTMLIKH